MDKKILIVDDAKFARSVIKRALANGNYCNTVEAVNAKEAENMFQSEKPDLTFLDISLPDCNDLTLMDRLLKIDPAAKIVICSALGQKLIIERAIKNGAKEFLVKPFDEKNLIEIVNKLL